MTYIRDIGDLAKEVHALAVEKGWYDGTNLSLSTEDVMTRAMNIVGEVAEFSEEARKLAPNALKFIYYEGLKPVGGAIELADVNIRALDLAQALNIDIVEAINVKHAYNKTRAHRHGGKRA